MRVLTCNVRCAGSTDGDNSWGFRKQVCLDVIRRQTADLICTQEAEDDQGPFLRAGLPEYEWFGMADEPQGSNAVNSIFYRRDLFHLVSAGGYWLSETPHIAGSSSWSSRCIRLCNWVRLIEAKSGKEVRLLNTHLDHVSQLARQNQARLINEDSAAYPATLAQVLTGDMNCNFANPAIAAFKSAGWTDTYEAIHRENNPCNTYHGFEGPAHGGAEGKIDWVFARGGLRTIGATIITTNVGGRYPSDHYFVSADVEFE